MVIDQLFSGKIRVKLLTKLLVNPVAKVYLRGLEKDLSVSSNTVRLELNKLSEMQLIEEVRDAGNSNKKHYAVNVTHPLFESLRNIILQYVGIDQVLEHVVCKLGNVEGVYLTGDMAQGKNSYFVDLVLVGEIDKEYLHRLIDKVEALIDKKIRVGVISPHAFNDTYLSDMGINVNLLQKY